MPSPLWIDEDPRAHRWNSDELIRGEFNPWERYLAARGRPLPTGAELMRVRLGIPRLDTESASR